MHLVAMPKINRDSLASIKLPVPPIDEQDYSIHFIKKES
jgi:restriction endonuclease S subunit